MLSKNHPIILFIDRFGFSVYQDTLVNIPKFNFTPDLVVNFDVTNKEQFVSLLTTFIQINKIVGSSLAVILSDNVIYIKDLISPTQKSALAQSPKADLDDNKIHEDEVQNFLENVPFEEVLAKVIKVGNVNRIVAVNRDLVMTIADVFVSKGSTVESITPSFMYGQNVNFTLGLTLDNVRAILGNAEILRSGNLLTDQEKIIPFRNLENELKDSLAADKPELINGTKKQHKHRQYLLVGVFVILLIILAVVYLTLGASQAAPKSYKVKNSPISAENVPTAVPSSKPITAPSIIMPSSLELKNIKIKIVQSSQTDERAINLKDALLKIGFIDVVSEISEISIPEKSSIIFSQNIFSDLRNNIIAEARKVLPDISILESQDTNFTINIIVGKS